MRDILYKLGADLKFLKGEADFTKYLQNFVHLF